MVPCGLESTPFHLAYGRWRYQPSQTARGLNFTKVRVFLRVVQRRDAVLVLLCFNRASKIIRLQFLRAHFIAEKIEIKT